MTGINISHLCFVGTLLLVAALAVSGNADAGRPPAYGIGSWAENLGNHRVRVRVTDNASVVRAHLPWRRRDIDPEKKAILVYDAAGKQITNVLSVNVNREFGDIVFQPASGPGEYFVYYMPCTHNPLPTAYWDWCTTYTAPSDTADAAWAEQAKKQSADSGAEAQVLEIQARGESHRFDPMEVIATQDEMKQLRAAHASQGYLLFPEDRRFPIRMTDDLPLRWIESGPASSFSGEACRNEFYTYQIGVYAATKAVDDLAVTFSDLKSKQGAIIPSSAMRCFNLGGTDCLGRPLKKTFTVASGKTRALWLGVQIPSDATAGTYEGEVAIHPKGLEESKVSISLRVSRRVLEDSGDADLWRHSRLRWLDSTIGIDDEPVAPYTPVKVRKDKVSILGREIAYAPTGLPRSMVSNGIEILAAPITLSAQTSGGDTVWSGGKLRVLKSTPSTTVMKSESSSGALSLRCLSATDFDGYISFSATLKATKDTDLKDVRLTIPVRPEVAQYTMGFGKKGGYRPKEITWTWQPKSTNSMLWIGNVNAGFRCRISEDHSPFDAFEPTGGADLELWRNGGKGGCSVREEAGSVVVSAYTGPRSLKAGQEVQLRFSLLVTPVKPLDQSHFTDKHYQFYQQVVSPEAAQKTGATVINVHQGNELNPYISYPFLTTDKMKAYVDDAHKRDMKVEIYYTVREMSNFAKEIWALRSLGDEVYLNGKHDGDSWLYEHLGDSYCRGWHQPYPNGEVDDAIETTGASRWHNYYLEGLSWLIKNVGIDGLYLDGVAFNREGMRRVRKVMDKAKPGCLMDLHSGELWPYVGNGTANHYMEHFPYIDTLWFGEAFDYNESPDYWLVEISGIPFGLYGDMLQMPINPWRGMLYGMTGRYWSGPDPQHIWKIWDSFGIRDAKMVGFWSDSCPVKTNNKDVLATAYIKEGKTLISLASWAKDPVRCRLTIDWKALRLDPPKTHLTAPAIPDFQSEATFELSSEIPIEPGKGWLLTAGN